MAINAQKRVTRRCLPNPNKRPLLALTITRSIVRRCARGWGYHNIATHGNFNCKVRHNESQIHKVWVHVGGGKNDEDAFDLALERTSARTQEGLGRHADIIYGRPPMLHLFLFCVRFFSLVVLRVPRAGWITINAPAHSLRVLCYWCCRSVSAVVLRDSPLHFLGHWKHNRIVELDQSRCDLISSAPHSKVTVTRQTTLSLCLMISFLRNMRFLILTFSYCKQ